MWWKLAPTDARYSGKRKIAVESSARSKKRQKAFGSFHKKAARTDKKRRTNGKPQILPFDANCIAQESAICTKRFVHTMERFVHTLVRWKTAKAMFARTLRKPVFVARERRPHAAPPNAFTSLQQPLFFGLLIYNVQTPIAFNRSESIHAFPLPFAKMQRGTSSLLWPPEYYASFRHKTLQRKPISNYLTRLQCA